MISDPTDMSFAEDIQGPDPNEDIYQTLKSTYTQVQKILTATGHPSNGSISKYNYYGKKYRFQSVDYHDSPGLQTANSRSQTVQKSLGIKNVYEHVNPGYKHPETTQLKQIQDLNPKNPLKYRLTFDKVQVGKGVVTNQSQTKEKYLCQKVSALTKQMSQLKLQNERLKKLPKEIGKAAPTLRYPQKKIRLRSLMKDLF